MESDQDRQRKIELDSRNGLSQFDAISGLIDRMQGSLAISPEIVKGLHQLAMHELLPTAGLYRTCPVRIRGSHHRPPPADTVAGLVEQMCEDTNSSDWEPIKTSAFLLWRLSWIHPFEDGKERTSRAVSYMALCVQTGVTFPGKPMIPEQLTQNRHLYYTALADADAAWGNSSVIDVRKLEELLSMCLSKQLIYLDDSDRH